MDGISVSRNVSGRYPRLYFYARNFMRRLIGTRRKVRKQFEVLIEPGDLIFDIGANVGFYTEAFADLGARVVAVEPQPDLASRLTRKVNSKSAQIEVVSAAVSETSGTVELKMTSVDSLASVDPSFHDRHGDPHREFDWNRTLTVPARTLDSLCADFGVPDGIKIDVEGHELEALKSLSAPVRWILFETNRTLAEPIFRLLIGRGYENFWVRVSESNGFRNLVPLKSDEILRQVDSYDSSVDVLAVVG